MLRGIFFSLIDLYDILAKMNNGTALLNNVYIVIFHRPSGAYKALQIRGSLTMVASRCIMTLLPTRHLHSLHLIEKLLKWNWYEEALLHQMAFLHHAFNEHHVHSRKRCLNLVQEL